MNAITRSVLAVSLGLAPFLSVAQQQGSDEQASYIYASYFVCDLNRQDEVDRIIERSIAPIYQRAVEAGSITGWGWLQHHTGGPWRRLFYFTADSIDTLLAAQASLAEQEDANANERFDAACATHDDYIWRSLSAGGQRSARGNVSLSTYYVCDASKEDRADEIFQAVLAPIHETQVSNGLIRSWGWNEHVVGGQYRRLASMTADDWPQLFRAVDAYIAAAWADELGREMWEICPSHTDYMWNIERESR